MAKEEQIIEILNKTLTAHGWYSNTVISGKEQAAKEIMKLFTSSNNTKDVCKNCGKKEIYKDAPVCFDCLLKIYDEYNK